MCSKFAKMEAPDANGFVNITWPSKNVPHGGIFHTRIVNSSTEQQQFLKGCGVKYQRNPRITVQKDKNTVAFPLKKYVLVEESKLDTKLRHGSVYGLRREEQNAPAPARATPTPMVRPRTSRRRSLSAIRETRLLDEDSYRPIKKGEDREKLKERLANTMTYGDSPEQVVPAPMASQRTKKSVEKKLPTEKQKWHELVTQIRERAEWLAEMEYLGEGAAHREIINEQIAERMRALDALGIDSQCSTARSTVSGFSTTRSKEMALSPALNEKVASGRSNASIGSIKREDKKKRDFMLKFPAMENVAAYNKLSPLGYSPRRRV